MYIKLAYGSFMEMPSVLHYAYTIYIIYSVTWQPYLAFVRLELGKSLQMHLLFTSTHVPFGYDQGSSSMYCSQIDELIEQS